MTLTHHGRRYFSRIHIKCMPDQWQPGEKWRTLDSTEPVTCFQCLATDPTGAMWTSNEECVRESG